VNFLILLFLFLSITPLANAKELNPFEIPRSTVINIKDYDSDKIYPLFIKLPRSYNVKTKKSYPVIYLTDALYSFQVVSGATRFPMNTGKMQEAIIVGIAYSKGSGGHASRVRDYTHIEDKNWKYETGKAKEHMGFIEKSVFTFIEKNYRVNSSRTFVGNSLGGLLGAYIFFTKPNMFENYVLGSPSVWFKDNDILKLTLKPNLNKHKVYIAVGANETIDLDSPNHDIVNGAKNLQLKITKELFPNTEIKLLTIPGANHETAFPTTATQGLYWLFKKS
jgi:predicted alpha/beta superfamily hydrolase